MVVRHEVELHLRTVVGHGGNLGAALPEVGIRAPPYRFRPRPVVLTVAVAVDRDPRAAGLRFAVLDLRVDQLQYITVPNWK